MVVVYGHYGVGTFNKIGQILGKLLTTKNKGDTNAKRLNNPFWVKQPQVKIDLPCENLSTFSSCIAIFALNSSFFSWVVLNFVQSENFTLHYWEWIHLFVKIPFFKVEKNSWVNLVLKFCFSHLLCSCSLNLVSNFYK